MEGKKRIVKYWRDNTDINIFPCWEDAETLCWRCGYKFTKDLQRCHIIPKALGGSDSADNLILLCRNCHREAPDVNDSAFMLRWLEATMHCHEIRVFQEVLEEVFNVIGREWLSNPSPEDFDEDKFVNNFKDVYKTETSTHCGITSKSTSAYALIETLKKNNVI
jgi:hypothetical protein